MLDQETTTTIMKAVDAGFDDQIELTAELVRFPSVRGAEHTAQDFVAAEMRRRGLAIDRFPVKVEDIRQSSGLLAGACQLRQRLQRRRLPAR